MTEIVCYYHNLLCENTTVVVEIHRQSACIEFIDGLSKNKNNFYCVSELNMQFIVHL